MITSRTDYELGALGNTVATYDDVPTKSGELHHEFGVIDKLGARRYWVKDQLGSVRAVVRDGQVVEWNDYYAYGAVRDGATWSGKGERWKYLGKELDNETATQHLDAREYDGLVGRLWQVDPMWRLYPHQSPYLYANANPFRFSDRSGMASDSVTVAPEIVVTADREPPKKPVVTGAFVGTMSYPTTLNATPQIPPLLGGLVAILMLIWGVSQLSDGASSLSTPPMAPPRELPADATGVFRPFPGQLQEPIIMLASVNQINEKIKRGQAPSSFKRADKGKAYMEQDNIHFQADKIHPNHSLNRDGTWKHGGRTLTSPEKEFLLNNGWQLPKE